MTEPQIKKINDLELAVRTIDDLLPDMPTKSLQKWQAIFRSALSKIEAELVNTHLHTCNICFFQEWGYRDELPAIWYKKGNATICFQHEYKDAERLLKEAGYTDDAEEPTIIPGVTVDAIRVKMHNLVPKEEKDDTLKELMDLL